MNERAIYKLYSIMKFQKSPVDFDEVRSQLFRAREGMETEIDALIFASKLNVYSILCNTVKAKRLDVVKALIMEMDQACDLPIEICRWAVYAWASLFGKDELVKNCNYTFGVWSRRKGNLDTALVFFKEAAEAGHELALEQLLLLIPNENPNEFHEMNEWSDNGFDKVHAILKNFDTRVVFDKNEIVNSIIWLANGNIYASFILGLMYYYGYGRYVLRDRTEAAKWFHEAAKYEHSLAAYWLGAYYEHEELNFYRAFPYYKIAARRGYLDAYWNLAEFYSVGAEIEKDIDKALECYQRGADMGNVLCLLELGDIFFKGAMGIPPDIHKGLNLYLSAIRDYPDKADALQYNLGRMYYNGDEGLKQDREEGLKRLKTAAQTYFAAAVSMLADIYYHGNGVAQDKRKALGYYDWMTRMGNIDAYFRTAWMHDNGEGIEKSSSEADSYYHQLVTGENHNQWIFAY